jgi:hypothetical protein
MTEITMQCQACQARLTTPLPDTVQAPDGTIISADQMSLEDSQDALLAAVAFPRCGQTQSTVVEERISTKKTIPVYAVYRLYLERYIEVEADSMEEALAKAKAMASDGMIQRPRYTEGLDDWTEITDPHGIGRFLIDGEAT